MARRENVIVPIEITRERPFIRAACFDCHLARKNDVIASSSSSGERAVRNAQAKLDKHPQEGHRIFFVIGRRAK